MNDPVLAPRGEGMATAAVAAQFWVNGMIYASIVPRLPELRDELSIDIALLGLVLTISAVGGLVGSAVAGPAIARFGTRRTIMVGTIATMGLLPLVGFASSAVALGVTLACISLLDVMIDIGMNIQGSRLSSRRTTPIMNRLHGLWSFGTVTGGLLSVQAASRSIEIKLHLIMVAVLLLLVSVSFGRYLIPVDAPAGPEPANPDPKLVRAGLRGPFLLLALLGGAAVTMEMTSGDWASFRLADDLAVEPGRVGLGFVAFTLGMVVGRFLGDWVQAVLGARSLVRFAVLLAATGMLIATVVPWGFLPGSVGGLETEAVMALLGFFIAALGVAVLFPQLYDAAAKAPGPTGRGLGALTAGTRLAGLASPLVVGLLAASSLSVGSAMALATIPFCLLMFVIPGVPSDQDRSSPSPEPSS